MITTHQARYIVKQLNGELFNLEPSSLIVLFEIDITDILVAEEIALTASINPIFRFHNNIPQIGTSIFFDSNNDGNLEEFFAAPILAEGFEMNSRGTLPTPKLTMSVNEDGINYLSIFKSHIAMVGDIAGAKVTRIKTFAKCLDGKNFVDGINPESDPALLNSILQKDIFYIDRKSLENKTALEYELSSIFDLEGIQLPNRMIVSNHCVFTYRGEGCLYEYDNRRVKNVHGPYAVMPLAAPPIANENDEKMESLCAGYSHLNENFNRGKFNPNSTYFKNQWVYIEKDGIKYYYVAKQDNIAGEGQKPPNPVYWQADVCSKTIKGCKLRYSILEGEKAPGRLPINETYPNGPFDGALPFGGFPATSKVK